MITKIERGTARPTASLLGKLSAAFTVPLSNLFARIEEESGRLATSETQAVWRDPRSGYIRRALSPPGDSLLQLTHVELPARARVAFPASTYAFIHQQIWVIEGELTFHEGAAVNRLRRGDCLMLGPPSRCRFENATAKRCRYLVAVVRR
jgi:transcriptional regulator with XRE-family HTH domain